MTAIRQPDHQQPPPPALGSSTAAEKRGMYVVTMTHRSRPEKYIKRAREARYAE